jgi:hypothetical protein
MYLCAESLPEADFVVGFQSYSELPAVLQNALSPSGAQNAAQRRVQVRLINPSTKCIHDVSTLSNSLRITGAG